MVKRKNKYNISTIILSIVLTVLVVAVFPSNILLKKEYNNIDKSDPYWNYETILKQPFSHISIDGNNVITGVSFQQNSKSAVRVANVWNKAERDSIIKAFVKNDTLFLRFRSWSKNRTDNEWMRMNKFVSIISPRLESIDGNNTNFEVNKFTLNNISIKLKGKSNLEVETYKNSLGNIKVDARDSSIVAFKMADDFRGPRTITFDTVTANLKDFSALNIGYSYAGKLILNIEDGSAIALSGKSLKMLHK